MTEVAQGCVAETRPEVEALARRLIALRSDIDAILARLDAPRAPAQSEAAACAGEPAEEAVPPPAHQPTDDLTLISPIDGALAEALNRLGIAAFAQIAAWTKPDMARMSQALGLGRRIAKENWIEQAAVLASGRLTAFASRRLGFAPGSVADKACVALAPAAFALSAPDLPVLSLDPYRGVPRLPAPIRRLPRRMASSGMALAVKLVACLTALILAGLVMVDRDAWGSVPKARTAPLPLQAQVARDGRAAGVRAQARSLMASEGLLAADRP